MQIETKRTRKNSSTEIDTEEARGLSNLKRLLPRSVIGLIGNLLLHALNIFTSGLSEGAFVCFLIFAPCKRHKSAKENLPFQATQEPFMALLMRVSCYMRLDLLHYQRAVMFTSSSPRLHCSALSSRLQFTACSGFTSLFLILNIAVPSGASLVHFVVVDSTTQIEKNGQRAASTFSGLSPMWGG